MSRVLVLSVFAVSMMWLTSSFQLTFEPHNSALKQADRYFNRQAYEHALVLYHKVISKEPQSPKVKLRIAHCYRLLEDHKNAAFWFGQTLGSKHGEPTKDFLYYASSLCQIQQYAEAKIWYGRYLQKFPDDAQARAALASLSNMKSLINPDFQIEVFQMRGLEATFSPTIWNDNLVFVAPGNTGGIAKKVAAWDESAYFDLYFISLKRRNAYPHLMPESLNSIYHEGPAHFFDKGRQVILTRSSGSKSVNKSRNLQLMSSQRTSNGHWKEPKPLNISHPEVSMGHPCLDETTFTLYFVSDMPGGYGGTDLYRSKLLDGVWQQPVNLGPEINSPGNEMFPSFHKGSLYFASDGRGGLGGLDLFICRDLKSSSSPNNLGYPINSPQDDFGLVWQTESDGFLSSNRQGEDQIFKFSYIAPKN